MESKHNSVRGFDDSYARLMKLVGNSNSIYVKRQGYKSMINGLYEMGRPREAQVLMMILGEDETLLGVKN